MSAQSSKTTDNLRSITKDVRSIFIGPRISAQSTIMFAQSSKTTNYVRPIPKDVRPIFTAPRMSAQSHLMSAQLNKISPMMSAQSQKISTHLMNFTQSLSKSSQPPPNSAQSTQKAYNGAEDGHPHNLSNDLIPKSKNSSLLR